MATLPTWAQIRAVDPVVENLLGGLMNLDTQYIADEVLPPVEVAETTGTIFKLGGMFGDPSHNLRKAPGSSYHQNTGFSASPTTYRCERIGDEVFIDDDELQDNQIPADLEAMHLANIAENVVIRKERDTATVLFTAANWGSNATTLSGANQWNDPNSNPIGNIVTALEAIRAKGRRANTIVFGGAAYATFCQNAAVLNFLPTTRDRNLLTRQEAAGFFADRFNLPRFFIGDAVYNTANPGATQSLSDIWGDNVWIGYINDQSGAIVRNSLVNVQTSAAIRLVRDPMTRQVIEDEKEDGRILRLKHKEYVGTFQTELGYLISDVTA